MKTLITLLTVAAMGCLYAAPALANHVTLEECVAAVSHAKAHHDEWQEPAFTADECAAVANSVTDALAVLKNHRASKKDIAHAVAVLKNEARQTSTLNSAPAIKLTPKPKIHGSVATPHNAGRSTERRCLQTGYVEDGEGFHHLFVYDRCTGNIM